MDKKKSKGKPKGKAAKTKIPGIEKLPDGRFRVRARWTDITGKRYKREATVDTFPEAVALKHALRKRERSHQTKRRLRFEEFVQLFMETYALRVSASTTETTAHALKPSLVQFGKTYLDAITLPMVREWYAERVAQPGSVVTKNTQLKVLKMVLEQAVEDGLIERNPASKVRQKSTGPTKGARARWLDLEGFARFQATTQELMQSREILEDRGRYILTLLWTGCRFGEVAALRWKDIRHERNELFIQRAISLREEKETKTRLNRTIPMSHMLQKVLTEQSSWLPNQAIARVETGLVFPRERPDKWSTHFRRTHQIDKVIRQVCEAAKLERITHHSLRRTMEQCLRLAGVDILVRRSILGWQTPDVQGIYAQVTPQERAKAITLLEEKVHLPGTLAFSDDSKGQ